MFNKLRDPVSGLTHLAAAVAAAAGLVILVYLGRDDTTKALSLLIYGASLVLMFASSSAYHLVKAKPQVTRFLRALDHSAIYLLIAGTYTPLCLHFFTGFWRDGFLRIAWLMAAVGILVKLFILDAPRWLSAGLYLAMGWMALLAFGVVYHSLPVGAFVWILIGGMFFTVGAIVYICRKPDFFPGKFGFHELWHIFVILGAASHFIVIARYIAAA